MEFCLPVQAVVTYATHRESYLFPTIIYNAFVDDVIICIILNDHIYRVVEGYDDVINYIEVSTYFKVRCR